MFLPKLHLKANIKEEEEQEQENYNAILAKLYLRCMLEQ